MQENFAGVQATGTPERIGAFTVLGVLGAGAMGRVFLAYSEDTGLAAVKVIRADLAADPVYRQRFAREITAARRVEGGHTAAVLDADPYADRPWLATEYIAAPTLAELVDTCGPQSEALVRWLAVGCLQALINVHGVGLIHRDVKPGNILVAEQGSLLIDFGLAHETGVAHLTRSDVSPGTPAFMAPEQIDRRGELSAAADVYALGATLAFAASGRPPFPGPGVEATVYQILSGTPDLSDVPQPLVPLLTACLARDAGARPTCVELLAQLEGTPIAAPMSDQGRALIERHAAAQRILHEQLRTAATMAAAVEHGESGRTPLTLTSHRAERKPARTWMAAAACSTAVIGVTAGLVYGVLSEWPLSPAAQDTVAASAASAGSQSVPRGSGPPQYPPGGGPPGPFGPVLAPTLSIEPTIGGPGTVFTVRGTHWPPEQPVSITLEAPGAAPLLVLANPDGTVQATVNPGVLEHRSNGAAPGSYVLHVYAGPAYADIAFTITSGSPGT
jgi:hypothetical protein